MVDPRTVDAARLAHLRSLGFNRLSFGVQDFDPAVQKAVHRVQPFEQVAALMRDARELGYQSTNVDLIYGLPYQTTESLIETVDLAVGFKPMRIALFGYAHVPGVIPRQRRIDAASLPGQRTRFAIAARGA